MATYQITINEKMALGKSVIAFLHSIPQAVTVEMPKKKPPPKTICITGSTAHLRMYD